MARETCREGKQASKRNEWGRRQHLAPARYPDVRKWEEDKRIGEERRRSPVGILVEPNFTYSILFLNHFLFLFPPFSRKVQFDFSYSSIMIITPLRKIYLSIISTYLLQTRHDMCVPVPVCICMYEQNPPPTKNKKETGGEKLFFLEFPFICN